ncbi:MAG: polyisoprenyl-teichoic acid--peptidoglycan teichoic acid transferase [Chloroflexota bacterium]|jgi:LCP family protein required for cell wall assembly|nr:polyisoprenyl-teichoic acid--peptidoglycan teichoic acid transferase [Chloroflexota bacterium]
MHDAQDARPRARSPFTAAFLSLLFPGLGHLYAGASSRALAFAAAPVLVIALLAGIVLRLDRIELVGLVLNPFLLSSVFAANLIALLYRLIAIVDAYRVAEYMNAITISGDGRLGPARIPRRPLSIAGLLAVLLVMAGSHVVVARYDMLALDLLNSGCIFVGGQSTPVCEVDANTTPAPGDSAAPSEPLATAVGAPVPDVSIPPWDGKQRLNVLLIGTDQRPKEGTYNTDTLIVVSIDPQTRQVAMFSLPRDTVDVPVPPGPAQQAFGPTYSKKINAWFTAVRNRSDLFPGTDVTRGYNGLKAIIGNLYGLDIKYFVEVNFVGFRSVVDALGGVTINVQTPVVDDRYPGDNGSLERIYIPSGIQHMDGAQALQYARSRHASTDFDRGQRQQRVLLSLREQANPQDLIPRLPDLVTALKKAVRTDVPVDQLSQLLGLASEVNTKDIRSYVFAPPFYQQEFQNSPRGYIIVPYVDKIREAVRTAFTTNPADEALREKLAQEAGTVWVLNSTGGADRATSLAGYLEYFGLAASAPRQAPTGGVKADTAIVVYNGAETRLAGTIAYLEKAFAVTATTKADNAVHADIVITIGQATPDLQAPVTP